MYLPVVCVEPADTVVLWSEKQKCVFHDILFLIKCEVFLRNEDN